MEAIDLVDSENEVEAKEEEKNETLTCDGDDRGVLSDDEVDDADGEEVGGKEDAESEVQEDDSHLAASFGFNADDPTTALYQAQQVEADALLARLVDLTERDPGLFADASDQRYTPSPSSSSASSAVAVLSQPLSELMDSRLSASQQRELISEHTQHLFSASPFVDVHSLFVLYSRLFFFDSLQSVSVRWSNKMTSCAGLCRFDVNSGGCEIALSEALLRYRSKTEVVETLLHEMIHAFLFVGDRSLRDHDAHGDNFHRLMRRINSQLQLSISVYHSFTREVRQYKRHRWQCNGKCRQWKPYHGIVNRVSNRKPGPADQWWRTHQLNCGGEFIKVGGPSEAELKEERRVKARRKREEKRAEKERQDKKDGKEPKVKKATKKEKEADSRQRDLRDVVNGIKRPQQPQDGKEEKKREEKHDSNTEGGGGQKKRRMKGVKGRGHVLGSGDEKPKRRRTGQKAADASAPQSNSSSGSSASPAAATPAPATAVVYPPVLTSTASSPASRAVTSQSTSSQPAASSSSSPSTSVAPASVSRSTNIFALMQSRGDAHKIQTFVSRATTDSAH